MGCYNGEGCISGLPIEYKDPIGGLICVSSGDDQGCEIITPVWPIIWGAYDDYGGIEANAIDRDLEQYFGNRESILCDLERITHGCRDQIMEGLPDNLCLLIEHKDVLTTLIKLGNPEVIEANYHSGDWYRISPQSRQLFDCINIYNQYCCYRENQLFLKFFREQHGSDVPEDKLQSYFEAIALYESLIENFIFLKWQRFAGWQYPSRRDEVWKRLSKVYSKLTK